MKASFSLPQSIRTFAGIFLLPLSALSQDLPYESGSTQVDGALTFPAIFTPARYQHATAFDAERQETILFGGSGPGGAYGDTWAFGAAGWRLKQPPASPPAMQSHGMAYDAARKQVVVFGGTRPDGTYRGETWVWNGATWAQKSPAQSPSIRSRLAMVYDTARQQVVLFGGYNPQTGPSDETWTWDGTTWTQASPANRPQARADHAMAYDAERQQVVLYGGSNNNFETWTWDGTDWTKQSPTKNPTGLYNHAMAYDAQRKAVIMFGGYPWQVGGYSSETWSWDGTNWSLLSLSASPAARYNHAMSYDSVRGKIVLTGGYYYYSDETFLLGADKWDLWSSSSAAFDMSTRPGGVWNFTTIDIPAGITVYFRNNPANLPVRWLASGNVSINGFLNLNGDNGANGFASPGNEAKGGPGGYPGGLAAIRFDQSSSYTGTPGQGPGGGAPGVGAQDGYNNGLIYGKQGTYAETYGNAYIQPVLGGSGGGGAGSAYSGTYGNGGGGGGALLIASSRDINVNGGISANGGQPGSYGGAGSGGAIRLVADRVGGGGTLSATGGGPGRIRIEGFYRALAGNANPVASLSAPIVTRNFDNNSSLIVSKVAGKNVAQPPNGNSSSPDVIFTEPGDITVELRSQGLPENTPVRLRVTTATGVITKPAQGEPDVKLVGGVATFTLTVPAGLGTIQGFAEFTQQ